ncbi:Maf family protein [Guptibacillus algicola]|uniref:Maf family protein n=1 Tax=Guptibacillus algicola TaxID=225844 RepID=UPI001CD4DEE6|nr:Maf family protein [Alkalihalobacillus algicola]MCA0986217.1 Maf family protein [Alkalihalobacillus algicola]
MKHLVLASGSPRRKELLEQMNLTFDIIVSRFEEHISLSVPPSELVQQLAYGKASDVFNRTQDAVVLGSDTVVTLDGDVLVKPDNREHARQMLTALSGRTHTVYSGVSILSDGQQASFFEATDVTFWDLTDREIAQYLDTDEPYDKAGGYGIQGFGAAFVKCIQGDYYSVVGLPISKTLRELAAFGIVPEIQHKSDR